MRNISLFFVLIMMVFLLSACTDSDSTAYVPETPGVPDVPEIPGVPDVPETLVVNSLFEPASPTGGVTVLADKVMTLRTALELIADGGTISFHPDLDGKIIELSVVGEDHSILKGEVMGFDYANNISYLVGYFERDYGKSALYVRKSLTIDASALPNGITVAWNGTEPARVLAVYGDLTMNNVTVTGGNSVAEEIDSYNPNAKPGAENSQPWTLGRGGAVAVWGEARLTNCTLYDNHCLGDFDQSRDRGAFGGGIYADIVHISNCIISGNAVVGAGAAGGGVYSVGGADHVGTLSTVEQSSITGNRISGLFTYGGGVYSDGGGIGHLKTLSITNSTIARNLVEPPFGYLPPFLLPDLLNIGYWRAGGVYMSNGYMRIHSSTIVENEVYGKPRTDAGAKPNLAGGIAATIGDAHTVETMIIDQSIIADNEVFTLDDSGQPNGSYLNDIFTGSLLHFYSYGHNLIGQINFDHMLVPVPEWESLSRKHWPEEGDDSVFLIGDILGAPVTHDEIFSQGTDDGELAVLFYPPKGVAVDAVPADGYSVTHTLAGIINFNYYNPDTIDGFLYKVLSEIESKYGPAGFAADFQSDFESYLNTVDTDVEQEGLQPYQDDQGNDILTLADTLWFGPITTWPSEDENQAWLDFWHRLDSSLGDTMGMEKLADVFWGDFTYKNEVGYTSFGVRDKSQIVEKEQADQCGTPRTGLGDIGAIELNGSICLE